MQVKLRVLSGSHEGKEIVVGSNQFLIGRSDVCQLRPKSESVSRKHCVMVVRDGRVLIQDLKSRNGTFINDKRLPTDKAKVAQPGDHLRVGKLEFEVVIEHGLQGTKKPEVSDVSDAAERTVEAGSSESRFEAVDVGDWLDEADQIDRARKLSDPDTRQFQLESSTQSGQHDSKDTDSTELSVDDADSSDTASEKPAAKRPDKKKEPGKLPAGLKKALQDNSRDAADDALKRFFSGR